LHLVSTLWLAVSGWPSGDRDATDWRNSSAMRDNSRTLPGGVARVPSLVCSVTAKIFWMLSATAL
jgi:hypothetical protein